MNKSLVKSPSKININSKFYLNPITGRVIKSTGYTYKKVKRKGYKPTKHICIYNIRTAEKCLKKIMRLYPSIYPPSSFIKIPKTYEEGDARSFIKIDDKIVGYIDKYGNINILYKNIVTNKNLPLVSDPMDRLKEIVIDIPKNDKADYKKIIDQIESKPIIKTDQQIIYNPVQNDFIPSNKLLIKKDQLKLIDTINKNLIKLNDVDLGSGFKPQGSASRSKKYPNVLFDKSNNIIGYF